MLTVLIVLNVCALTQGTLQQLIELKIQIFIIGKN